MVNNQQTGINANASELPEDCQAVDHVAVMIKGIIYTGIPINLNGIVLGSLVRCNSRKKECSLVAHLPQSGIPDTHIVLCENCQANLSPNDWIPDHDISQFPVQLTKI